MLNLENDERFGLEEDLLAKLEEALNTIAAGEGITHETEVSLYLVDDAAIQEINAQYRGRDAATDCLSFPVINYPREKTFRESFAKASLRAEMFQGDVLLLGDIFLSVERARAQAAQYGHSLRREVVFLFVHSLLHLLGYDHMEAGERRRMREREEFYMTGLEVGRW